MTDVSTLPVASLELGRRVFDKAELLQLNHTQFICMITLNFIIKKLEIELLTINF